MHKNNFNIVGSYISESTECFNVNSAGRSPVMVDDVFFQPQRGWTDVFYFGLYVQLLRSWGSRPTQTPGFARRYSDWTAPQFSKKQLGQMSTLEQGLEQGRTEIIH